MAPLWVSPLPGLLSASLINEGRVYRPGPPSDGQTVCHSSELAWHRLEPGKWVRRQDQPPRVLEMSLQRRQAPLVPWTTVWESTRAEVFGKYPSGNRQSEELQVRAGTASSQTLPGCSPSLARPILLSCTGLQDRAQVRAAVASAMQSACLRLRDWY